MRAAAVALAVAGAVALAACGGGSDREDAIIAAIQSAVSSDNPADCTRLLSRRFIEQTTFETGGKAVVACKADARDTSNDPGSVDVAGVQIDGRRASASVAMHGGAFDGQTLRLALTRDRSDWKIDEITGIPSFDLDRFAVALQASLASGDNPLTDEQAHCVASQVAQSSPGKVKAVLLGGDASPFIALIQLCAT